MAEDALIALIELAVFYGTVMVAFSSLNGGGRDELQDRIRNAAIAGMSLGATIGIERVNSIRIGITRAPTARITSGFSSIRLAACGTTWP